MLQLLKDIQSMVKVEIKKILEKVEKINKASKEKQKYFDEQQQLKNLEKEKEEIKQEEVKYPVFIPVGQQLCPDVVNLNQTPSEQPNLKEEQLILVNEPTIIGEQIIEPQIVLPQQQYSGEALQKYQDPQQQYSGEALQKYQDPLLNDPELQLEIQEPQVEYQETHLEYQEPQLDYQEPKLVINKENEPKFLIEDRKLNSEEGILDKTKSVEISQNLIDCIDEGYIESSSPQEYIVSENKLDNCVQIKSFNNQLKYIIAQGYTAKKKDELNLPLGSEVFVLEEKGERSYVAAMSKHGQELDRGWVPTFSLQKKEDADRDLVSEKGSYL